MNVLELTTILLLLASVFSIINLRLLKLPQTIGLMILAIGLSISVLAIGFIAPDFLKTVTSLIQSFDFEVLLIDVMLPFLLFAGAISVNVHELLKDKVTILLLASFGVMFSTFVVGSGIFWLVEQPIFGLSNIGLSYVDCLLFGALIAPTDPIAVLAMVKKMNLSPTTETRIAGESLFNDGIAQNDIDYKFNDAYIGVHYRFKSGKFTITPGFSVHSYGNKNDQFGTIVEDNFIKFLPDFETRIQLKKGESLTFNYNMRNQFTDVTRLARGLVFNSYNNIQFGEPDLQNALSHNISMLYRSFNLFNYTNVFARAAYSSNIDQIRGLTNFENVIRTSSYFNSNFADENFNLFGRIQRTFGKVRASLRTYFNYSKINQFIQQRRSLNESFTQVYTPEIRTNFRVAPNISLRYRYSISNLSLIHI